MAASFKTFCGALGYDPQLKASVVAKALGFNGRISLWTVMNETGAPVAPQLISTYVSGGQFNWLDPSDQLTSPPPLTKIRRATSFDFTLSPPGSAEVNDTFPAALIPAGSGNFFYNGQGQWAYNYPGSVGLHGIYTWQVTSINDYGSASSKTTFGTNAPTIWFKVAANQESAIVYGAGFEDPNCTVTASCTDFPTSTEKGNIVSGVTVNIQCQNEGQYWNVSVASDDGSAPVPGRINCSGGAFP
jgi:hypothetical protein